MEKSSSSVISKGEESSCSPAPGDVAQPQGGFSAVSSHQLEDKLEELKCFCARMITAGVSSAVEGLATSLFSGLISFLAA